MIIISPKNANKEFRDKYYKDYCTWNAIHSINRQLIDKYDGRKKQVIVPYFWYLNGFNVIVDKNEQTRIFNEIVVPKFNKAGWNIDIKMSDNKKDRDIIFTSIKKKNTKNRFKLMIIE